MKKERDQALYKSFRKALSEFSPATLREREVVRYVCKQPAPRFYIESERAVELVGRILAGVSLIDLNNCSRRMTWELYRRYKAYCKEHPDCKLSRNRIMQDIVEEPAPEFYIETQRARKIIYKERKRRLHKWSTSTHV